MGEATERLIALSKAPMLHYSIADGVKDKRFAMVRDLNVSTTKIIGHIGWFTDPERKGEIVSASVDPAYRRQGIATELFRRAKKDEPSLRHSTALSDDAKAWIAGMARDGDGDGLVDDGKPTERPA